MRPQNPLDWVAFVFLLIGAFAWGYFITDVNILDALYAYCQAKVAAQPRVRGTPRPRLRYSKRVAAHLEEDSQ